MSATQAVQIERPSALLALTELPRALMELGTVPFATPMLASAPRGDGHPVLVIPGFITTDRSTGLLRVYLENLGYDVYAWELGRNLGPKAVGPGGERLIARLQEIYEKTGKKVSLVGWSLGGVLARQVSRRLPHAVRQIITLGSPFTGKPEATTVRHAYERMTGQLLQDKDTQEQLRESKLVPPVPSTAIFSRFDGIVAWQNCIEPEAATTDNIEVRGSHCGLGINPLVLYAIADRLAQADGEWKPFERDGFKAWIYPSSGHDMN